MTFSLRSILLVTAVVGVWLGALLSKAPVAIELVAAATNLALLLAVTLAIWHPQADHRKFWTGFCVLGLGNFLLAHYFAAYQTTADVVASAVAGDPNSGWNSYPPASLSWSPTTTLISPPNAPMNSVVPSGYIATYDPYGGIVQTQYHQAIRKGVGAILSLLAACAGGWLTLGIARQRERAQSL